MRAPKTTIALLAAGIGAGTSLLIAVPSSAAPSTPPVRAHAAAPSRSAVAKPSAPPAPRSTSTTDPGTPSAAATTAPGSTAPIAVNAGGGPTTGPHSDADLLVDAGTVVAGLGLLIGAGVVTTGRVRRNRGGLGVR